MRGRRRHASRVVSRLAGCALVATALPGCVFSLFSSHTPMIDDEEERLDRLEKRMDGIEERLPPEPSVSPVAPAAPTAPGAPGTPPSKSN